MICKTRTNQLLRTGTYGKRLSVVFKQLAFSYIEILGITIPTSERNISKKYAIY